jgi:hypothetical protein
MSVTFHDILTVYNKELVEKYNNVFSKEYSIETDSNKNENIINIYSNEKKIMSAKYETLGVYDEKINIFIWGKNMNYFNNNPSQKLKEIFNYSEKIKSLILKNKYSDTDFLETLLYYISHNMIYINNYNISNILMLCSFVSKNIVLHQRDNSNPEYPQITFYLITDILSY